MKMELKCYKKLRGFRFLIAKTYFDKGWNFFGYIKYLIALFGVSSLNVKATLLIGLLYGICCYVFGYLWYKYKYVETEIEIGNIFNPYVRQMREVHNRKI